MGLAQEAARRGHRFDVFGHEPIHPEVHRSLVAAGATWSTIDSLLCDRFGTVRRLARDFDVIHLNLFAPRDPVAILAYCAWPARVIFVDHISGNGVPASPVRAAVRRFLDSLVAPRVAAIAGVSNYVRDRDRARFGRWVGVIETIYGGVDIGRFAAPARPARGRVRLAAVANLIPEKGVDVLLRAIAGLAGADIDVRIVGDGPEQGALQDLATELALGERVTFCGLRDDVAPLLGDADIFVHPARWQEAFGLTVAEAMAAQCATVASRVGALPELIEDGTSGLLVPPGDVGALMAALRRLIVDPNLRKALGRSARSRVETLFRIERSVTKHLDRCEEVAGLRVSHPTALSEPPVQGS